MFFGVLKDLVGHAEETLEIGPQTTVRNLFETLMERYETPQGRRPSNLFARNREFVSGDAVLTDRDEVAFLPPVSGGTDQPALQNVDDQGFFAIVREPIDTRELVSRTQGHSDGAVVVFEGVVRNNTKGRATEYLEYECYEAMALQQMSEIGRQIAREFELGRISIVHRVGRLEIGEASVVIVVSAPHRGAAFDAARRGIDRLKREVPIWKKEYFTDGAVWVDGEWDERLRAGAVAPHAL